MRINVAMPQAMRATDNAPMLFLPLRAGCTFKVGRKEWQPGPALAILVAAGHEYAAEAPAGALLGLRVDGALLNRAISDRLRGRPKALLLKSLEIPMEAGRLESLRGLHNRLIAVGQGACHWGPFESVETFEAEVAAWLAGLVIEQSGARVASTESLQRIERLERWLDAHLGEHVTLDRLCTVSGVGSRALQKLMMARYGQTPLEWVHARRLKVARARLLRAPGTAISSVAMDCGFTHLGRFSAAYRKAHGELPSATLAGAMSRCLGR